jgi:hypothetical protein
MLGIGGALAAWRVMACAFCTSNYTAKLVAKSQVQAVTPEAHKEKNSKLLQIPSNEFLQMKLFERFSAMKFL